MSKAKSYIEEDPLRSYTRSLAAPLHILLCPFEHNWSNVIIRSFSIHICLVKNTLRPHRSASSTNESSIRATGKPPGQIAELRSCLPLSLHDSVGGLRVWFHLPALAFYNLSVSAPCPHDCDTYPVCLRELHCSRSMSPLPVLDSRWALCI